MILKIKEEFKADFITRAAGERLRARIKGENREITLDFSGLKIASASFFDEGIAKLSMEGWDSKTLVSKLKLCNIFKRDFELLENVCASRGLNLEGISVNLSN